MKYCLTIRKKGLPPYLITGFNKINGFEHLNDTSLQGIVEFTHHFENQVQLIYFLMENKLVPANYFNGEFGIDYFKSKKEKNGKTLQYGISFQKDAKYYDTEFLQVYFAKHLEEKTFYTKFIKKYYIPLNTIPRFSEDLDMIKFHVNVSHSAMNFVFYYTTVKKGDGYVSSFTKIRDLAMFAIDYERSLKLDSDLPEYDLNNLKQALGHYQELLEQSNLAEDERNTYEQQVDTLNEQIKITQMSLKRSK